MTLKLAEEEVVYKLPSTKKHPMYQYDECYFAHKPNLFISDFIQDVFVVNLLHEYFKLKLEGESTQPTKPPLQQINRRSDSSTTITSKV